MKGGRPPDAVLAAFGVEAQPRRLTGGQGTSWVAGELVLKPGGGPVHDWLADALHDVVPDGFRLALPVRTLAGAWAWDGWTATRWVDGAPDRTSATSWADVVTAGRSFHRALAHLARPACLDVRTDRWAYADRAAWGELVVPLVPPLADLGPRLQEALEPLGPAQVVHGDLTGNVLLSTGLPPAVIDVSPYWRPPEYAEAIVLADALCWHGAPASLLEGSGVSSAALARALLFRITTTSLAVEAGTDGVDVLDEVRRYRAALSAIGL